MKLDLKEYKLAQHDNSHMTLQHPDGHTLRISKAKITPKESQQILKLCSGGQVQKLYKGGTSGEQDDFEESTPPQSFGSTFTASPTTTPEPTPFSSYPSMNASPPLGSSPSPASVPDSSDSVYPAPMQQQAMPGPNPGDAEMEKALKGQQQAYRTMGQDSAQAQDQMAESLEDKSRRMDMAQSDYMDNMQQTQAEHDMVMDEYAKGEVNPRKYMDNMSTGGKIATAVGLILGGMGGGLLHQENPVLKFLNSEIDRDIEGQKANLDKKKSLVSMYYHKFGNIHDAANMAKANLLGTAQMDLQAGLAKSQSAKDNGAAAVAAQGIAQQIAMLHQATAQRRSIDVGLANGTITPAEAIPLKVPPQRQKEATESLDKLREVESFRTELKAAHQEIANMALNGLWNPAQVAAVKGALLGKIGKMTTNRFNLEEAQTTIDSLFPQKKDDMLGILGGKTQSMKKHNIDRLMDLMSDETGSVLDMYHIPRPKKSPTFNKK